MNVNGNYWARDGDILTVTAYPGIFPPGPMAVPNMRLNSRGGERALPVRGALTPYL